MDGRWLGSPEMLFDLSQFIHPLGTRFLSCPRSSGYRTGCWSGQRPVSYLEFTARWGPGLGHQAQVAHPQKSGGHHRMGLGADWAPDPGISSGLA